ncbi:MAG: hypothetical protein AB2556_16095 [Candidatus Thiodiazotropha sp.]
MRQQADLYAEDLGKAHAEAEQAKADAELVRAEAQAARLVLEEEVEKAQRNGNQPPLRSNRKKRDRT